MKTTGLRALAGAMALVLAVPTAGLAQDVPDQQAAPDQQAPPDQQAGQDQQAAAQAMDPAQLAAILAPVALYPDPLLTDILAASTYPLEVVEANRWLADPANTNLTGDQLLAALQQKDWDPSVKSLVPFPAILKMMDNQLDWTQQLGNAFLSQEGQVMDAVQQLRRQAEAAGGLVSTPQQTVSDNSGAVVIQPTNPQEVSVPAYDPAAVYGDWPYPDAPPIAMGAYDPDEFDGAYADGWYFGPPILLATSVWFWGGFDWHHHRIDLDHRRFDRFDPHHPFSANNTWVHDPAHRRGVAYASAGLQQRFQQGRGVPHTIPAAGGFGGGGFRNDPHQPFSRSTTSPRPEDTSARPMTPQQQPQRTMPQVQQPQRIMQPPQQQQQRVMPQPQRMPQQAPVQAAPVRAPVAPVARPPVVVSRPIMPGGYQRPFVRQQPAMRTNFAAPSFNRFSAPANFSAPARFAAPMHVSAPSFAAHGVSGGGGHR